MTVTLVSPSSPALTSVIAGRQRRRRRWALITGILVLLVIAAFSLSLMLGQTAYSPVQVWGVLTGQRVSGASFTVGELRLPRAVTGLFTGLCFGMGGVIFQSMLRNALASPDVIGINTGASAAAVIGIVVLGLGETAVSFLAMAAALAAALAIYLLAYRNGGSGARLILVGIGVAAMCQAVVSYVIARAAEYDLPAAMRWITGNLNDATWDRTLPVMVAVLVLGPVVLSLSGRLEILRMGDETAAAVGLPVERSRVLLIVAAVGLLAFGTAAAGPIAFVSFLAGPIAVRLLGPVGSPILPAGLIGALLVLVADFCGQYAFGTRLPVGVITGVLGAPYLIYLLVRSSRSGGTSL
ncbi:iron chelate uptake ABC transporter family permease subunit [Microbacterium sp. Kw_RZR3]|uniref:FecCD family ABC transporter permease n=1 Tax=unclassified Microbacterium TaxID=2609290 RepID=UPI0023DB1D31|nr:iron chelate uptake ABC transporter family permease subunit [Microbacterium sp. Kw_RZR3]MDF2046338.1 iron chelate uptake ABC transporter family permease subunit [Microbacterium sp. Kw_RZR3]MDF2918640.1 ABC-type Fe3+-siderophore transport system, permease component [Microbacterium sp.]